MKISVEYKNSEQETVIREENLSYLAFMKHLAFKGLGGHFDDYKLRRFLRYFVEYQNIFDKSSNAFKLPLSIQNDPNEVNYITNKIGKVIADFVAKKVGNAKFTVNYESALAKNGDEIPNVRPDLYCFNNQLKTQFSIKAKGLTKKTVYPNEVEKYRVQPQEGKLLNHASATSVAYNIYDNIQIKFYDSIEPPSEYMEELNNQLIEDYYNNIRFMFESFKTEDLTFYNLPDEIKNNFVAFKVVDLYKYELVNRNDFQRVRHYWKLYSDILELYILVHKNIINYSNLVEFESITNYDTPDYYIDQDGIGTCFLTK